MTQARQPKTAVKATPAKQSAAAASAKTGQKDWSVKVEVRLPHKIGQPLGSSSSDGGSY
jgi:hypothetical protein